jgi:hypothetical protein
MPGSFCGFGDLGQATWRGDDAGTSGIGRTARNQCVESLKQANRKKRVYALFLRRKKQLQ